MRRAAIIAGAVVAAVVVAGVAWWMTRDTSTTAVDRSDAPGLVGAGDAPADVEPGERPEPGTYEYVGHGRDHFSALGGAGHEFPERISVVVELDARDDCAWTMHVVFVEEHVEERRFCTEGDAILDRGFSRTTEFLGRGNTSSYACDDGAWRVRAGARARDTWRWTCRERRGGEVAYVATFLGDARVEVDRTEMPATHVRIEGTQDDDSTGRERGELWLLPSGLPIRFTSDRTLTVRTPIGSMTTTEDWDYVLAQRAPVA